MSPFSGDFRTQKQDLLEAKHLGIRHVEAVKLYWDLGDENGVTGTDLEPG